MLTTGLQDETEANVGGLLSSKTYNRRLEFALEILVRAKQATGARKVKQRPQLVQRVLRPISGWSDNQQNAKKKVKKTIFN